MLRLSEETARYFINVGVFVVSRKRASIHRLRFSDGADAVEALNRLRFSCGQWIAACGVFKL